MSEARPPLHGVLPICPSPFTADDRLDVASLGRVVDHIAASGAHGLTYPAIASEFQTLQRAEREKGVEVVSAALAGRIPLVVGVTASSQAERLKLTEHARAAGASAVMVMPAARTEARALVSELRELAAAAGLPVILQNAPPPLGPGLTIEDVVALIDAVEAIDYVKEETLPTGQRITRLLEQAPTNLVGVFGGAGGRFLMDELARGAIGSMPACEFTAMHVAILQRFRAGDPDGARVMFDTLLPSLNFGGVFRTAATKEVLAWSGLITSARYRDANPALDAFDRTELSGIVNRLRKASASFGVRLTPTMEEDDR